jgi:hypothetical protein
MNQLFQTCFHVDFGFGLHTIARVLYRSVFSNLGSRIGALRLDFVWID